MKALKRYLALKPNPQIHKIYEIKKFLDQSFSKLRHVKKKDLQSLNRQAKRKYSDWNITFYEKNGIVYADMAKGGLSYPGLKAS